MSEETQNDQAKKDICSSPYLKDKTEEMSTQEIQNKINKLNIIYEEEERNSVRLAEEEAEGAENINEIMMRNNIKKKIPERKDILERNEEEDKIAETKGNIEGIETKTETMSEINPKEIGAKATTKVITPQCISEFEVVNQDPYLRPFEKKIKERVEGYKSLLAEIEKNEGSLLEFAHSYRRMGLIVSEEGITYREYAPGAKSLTIFGDFNNWNRTEFHCKRDNFGFWSITLPLKSNGELPIKHNTKVKVNLTLANGKKEDRNPIWTRYLRQNKDSFLYDTVFWNPLEPYEWVNEGFLPRPKSLRIYEAHVGMSSMEGKVATYREFADNVLPRIKDAGYTAVQLMAIMEHAYYASFGYHVTNFFAISERSGTPDDFKYLIDTAHGLGIYVIMDIIHSHASSNVLDGLNLFDGTDYLYFHGGARGWHKLWDSRIFNYKNWETLRFLLSNCAWYLEEYHFDGFRFDGVTSILYKNHGINYTFSGGLNEYFNDNVDVDGEIYVMLANNLIHTINPDAITVAEDVSGMPALCRPISEGGMGFDYRLNMSVPDKWIELLKEYKDEHWNMGNLCYTLTNRRHNEKHITYCESHDQSIVGDKTLSMWLFDKEIYYNMSLIRPATIVVDRGMALHKMIRLITFSLGGEAYMNFIGNEFGHPEWVDFPRAGNNYSFHYCRRQWNLCDDKNLRFQFLFKFDQCMNQLDAVFEILNAKTQYITLMHERDKLIVFERGDLLFIFNFHPYQSFDHYRIGTKWATPHKIILDTDEARFHGKERLKYGHDNSFPVVREKWMNRPNYFQLYIPSRTGIVLVAEENIDKYESGIESLKEL